MTILHHTTLREALDHRGVVNLNSTERYLSAAGGAFLVVSGLRPGAAGKLLRLLVGAEMLRRGLTGYSYAYQAAGINTAPKTGQTSVPYELGVHVRLSLTIGRPRAEVFRFWRDFTNLSKVMRHVISVERREKEVTRWTVEGPMDKRWHWDAEVVGEVENERVAWRSLPGSKVDSAGSVRFADAPGDRGTEVRIELQYNPPAGYVGAVAAKLFGRDARAMIESDCWRLKQYLECGEIATIEGQPSGPSSRELRWRSLESRRAEAHRAKAEKAAGTESGRAEHESSVLVR